MKAMKPKAKNQDDSLVLSHNQKCLVVLSAISFISAAIALAGTWYHDPVNPAYVGGCDITLQWDLWRHRCQYVEGYCEAYTSQCKYCRNADKCFSDIPGHNATVGNGKALKAVESFVIMQFIFSVFAGGAMFREAYYAMVLHGMTALCGIIAMSVFIGLVKSYLPPAKDDYFYGYGFAWCVIGWCCAVVAGFFARRVAHEEAGKTKGAEVEAAQTSPQPEDFRTAHTIPHPEDFRTASGRPIPHPEDPV